MRFDELNEDNYILFAIKNYDNPQAATKEDFFEDMRRFKSVSYTHLTLPTSRAV